MTRRLAAILCGLALFAAACGGDGGTTAGPDLGSDPDRIATTAPLIGGGEYDLSAIAGQDAIVWFWAPW